MDYRMLTYGRLADEFTEYINEKQSKIHILKASTETDIHRMLPDVNALAGFNFISDQDISHIQWIHAFGAGVDSYVTIPSLSPNTILSRTSGDIGAKMAEYCLAYVLEDLKSISVLKENQSTNTWKQLPTMDLFELDVLILGTGTIGQSIARVFQRLANRVIGLNSSRHKQPGFDEIWDWKDLRKKDAVDIVINSLPSTEKTNSILNNTFFEHFSNTLFLNVGRGETVDDDALIHAVSNGQIRKAILDVFREEPLPRTHEFWNHENVVITPHQSGLTTIDDVTASFENVYNAIKSNEPNPLIVDLKKQY